MAETTRPVAALLGKPDMLDQLYTAATLHRLASFADLRTGHHTHEQLDSLADVQWLFSTWGMPCLDAAELDALPRLDTVFYAAGSVKSFAPPLLDRGIRVVSAWKVNARPVAEFTLAQILLSGKGYFRNVAANTPTKPTHDLPVGPGIAALDVALLGFGAIGRLVAALLQRFDCRVVAVDPHVDQASLDQHGVRRVTLDEAFATCTVVSNHLPNLASLHGVLNEPLFRSMPNGATFINTGRGAQVDEPGLIRALHDRPDLTALLDVTHPEPPAPDSQLYTLPNVRLSGHIAGSVGREIPRMAEHVVEQAHRLLHGQPIETVTAEMLATMA